MFNAYLPDWYAYPWALLLVEIVDYNLLWSGSPYSHIIEVMSLSSVLLQAFELVRYERRHVKLKHSLALEQFYRSWSHDAILSLAKPEKKHQTSPQSALTCMKMFFLEIQWNN